MPDDHDVPAFHPFASEHPAMRWDFRVRHYADAAQQSLDWKSRDATVLYPRAATLGGCTAHNALVLMAPPDADWDAIAEATGEIIIIQDLLLNYVILFPMNSELKWKNL